MILVLLWQRRQVTRKGGLGRQRRVIERKKGEHESDRDIQRVEKTRKKGGVGMKACTAALPDM